MKRFFCIITACLGWIHSATAQIEPSALQQWRDRKYSMFIHFGVYSKLGGVWENKQISRGLSEQIRAHAAGLYNDAYESVAQEFNPAQWNPDSIAILAKRAGMKSVVITSKHHDGFALWDCAYTTFDIMDATPYRHDILQELSEACRRQGIAFGLYFSLIDWHFPPAMPISGSNSDSIPPAHHTYNMQQITELLTKYGPVSELWFDMGQMTRQQSGEMRALVHKLQPNCMIGSRIGNNQGDFTVMGDNQEPDYIIGVPWQSPASFFHETWGYRSWQERGDINAKIREKLTSLVRVASRGGNFLLNIGPKGDGTVVEFERDALLAIGQWLNTNSEAIYGTQPDPFHVPFDWGSITSRKNKLYLHLMNRPANNTIVLPGLKGKVSAARIIGGPARVKTFDGKDGLHIQLPETLDMSGLFQVLELTLPNGYTVPPANIRTMAAGLVLDNSNAFPYFSNATIDYNTSFTSTIRNAWALEPQRSGAFRPTLTYSEEEKGRTIDLELGNKTTPVLLDGGKAEPLNNDIASLQTGPIHILGPLYSGPGGTHGSLAQVDPSKPWPRQDGKNWVAHPEWKNGTEYAIDAKRPAGAMTAHYLLQEITTPSARNVLVKLTSGDGIMVFLNGRQLLIQNNPFRKEKLDHYVLLPLQAGKNQLAVKLFNYFLNAVPFNIDFNVPQVVYHLELPEVRMQKGAYFPVSWQLHNPSTPHDEMGLPNLKLTFE
ncbi:alpha-L-fucosidase [Chitinophaga rhizosphaerae]|uniref:alpha-L-fucosidase n=1 Tax=Chitinophaga rhizosphaerae TaxID=1864947 RepID=UPI000F7FF485|nr:alpha-L-fucosidase [Chitinophaga rhizosphaerae]